MKKTMSVLLVLLLSLSLMIPAFAADTCYVAGTQELCGSAWQASDANNAMSLVGNVYKKVYPSVPVGDYQFKVVYNGEWKGNGNDNVMFSVTSPCDVTITYDPATGTVGYSGSHVGKTSFKVNQIGVAGAKVASAPNWLNGEDWNPAAAGNQAQRIREGVYRITFDDVPAGSYEFKFTADQAWTHSWGGTFTAFGEPADAIYNGSNIQFTLEEKARVTLELNLTGFDLATGGAKFTVLLNEDPVSPPSSEPTEPTQPTQPVTDKDYYVAGVKELCGTLWEANTPANKMTKDSKGLYVKTFKNVPQGTYQLKITDGTWDNCWGGNGPEGNFEFTNDQAGDVTVKFDPATKQITVVTAGGTSETTPTVPTTPGAKFYVTGNGDLLGNWTADFPKGQMEHLGGESYRVSFNNLPAGEYEFKVTDGTWNRSWGDSNGGNYKFKLAEAQKVTITFTANTGNIDVKTSAPGTADLGMLPVFGAALCAAMGIFMLLMNKKKLI